jgi:hypothetical protein
MYIGNPIGRAGNILELNVKDNSVKTDLQEMKEIIINTARPFLSPKQVLSLLEQADETSSSDPSIQFFRLELSLFKKRWKKVWKKIFFYRKNLETDFVDFPRLFSIVELINSTNDDLNLHCWAVVTDQLTEDKLKEQLFVQDVIFGGNYKVRQTKVKCSRVHK